VSVFKKYINNEEPSKSAAKPTSPSEQPRNQQKPAQSTASSSSQKPASSTSSVPSSKVAATNGRNVLSSDVEIKGKVKFTNDLVVDGIIEGEINSDGSLTVGENARIKAEINTRSVVIYGKVYGNINVTDRVDLKAGAELVGDIKAAILSIEPGAIFVGKSTVGAPSSQPSAEKTNNKPVNQKKGKLVAS